jgi:hypothetical protein
MTDIRKLMTDGIARDRRSAVSSTGFRNLAVIPYSGVGSVTSPILDEQAAKDLTELLVHHSDWKTP